MAHIVCVCVCVLNQVGLSFLLSFTTQSLQPILVPHMSSVFPSLAKATHQVLTRKGSYGWSAVWLDSGIRLHPPSSLPGLLQCTPESFSAAGTAAHPLRHRRAPFLSVHSPLGSTFSPSPSNPHHTPRKAGIITPILQMGKPRPREPQISA